MYVCFASVLGMALTDALQGLQSTMEARSLCICMGPLQATAGPFSILQVPSQTAHQQHML